MSITKEKLDELEGLRAGFVVACEMERKALAIRVENNRGVKYRNAVLGKAHAAVNDAGVVLANASRDALPALLAAARELDTLRAQLREVTAERDAAQYLAGRRGADLDVLRAQLREVTAQRDELREAAANYRACTANAFPPDSFGARKRALERLTKAIEATR